MKRSKKLVVTLASLLLVSGMAVNASAASVTFGTSNSSNVICVSSNGTGFQSGFDEDFFWGCINPYGNTNPSDESSNCSQTGSAFNRSLSDAMDSYLSAAVNAENQNSGCSSANESAGSDCTSSNAASTPAPADGQSPDSGTVSAEDADGKAAAPGSACDTGPAVKNTDSSFCAAASSCPTEDCTTNTCAESGEEHGFFSGFSFTACTQPISDLLNSIFAKCGISICLPGCSDPSDCAQTAEPSPAGSETAATPQPSDPSDTTAAETPASTNTNSDDSETASPAGSDSGTTGSSSADSLTFEQQVAALVNEQRAVYGLAPLTLSESLSDVARAKSQDMHDNSYFSHTSPTYGSPFEMMSSFGITYRTAGENIAMGYTTPEAVMNAWMNSEGHRANILNASFTQIGVGYVADGNYWTQEFIG